MSEELERALVNLARAVKFFDKVQASSEEEKIAVGRDHWDWIVGASKETAAAWDQQCAPR